MDIRDELAQVIHLYWDAPLCKQENPPHAEHFKQADALMPLVRRAQAEAGARALRDFRTRLMDQNIDRFGVVLPDLHEVLDDLDEEADRIEQEEAGA